MFGFGRRRYLAYEVGEITDNLKPSFTEVNKIHHYLSLHSTRLTISDFGFKITFQEIIIL